MLARRFPVYLRPLPAALCALAIVLGLFLGPNWRWDWSLQTGNVFLLIQIPGAFISFQPAKLVWFTLLVLGLAGFVAFARVSRKSAALAAAERRRGLLAPRMRWYPIAMLWGLFLAYFGIVFLFKASLAGDAGPGAVAAFVYLNYDGILNRALISILGAVLTAVGLFAIARLAFEWGLGFAPATRAFPRASSAAAATTRAPSRTLGVRVQTAKPVARTPRPAPSAGRPSSTSPPARSRASPSRPARTAKASTRP